MQPTRRRHQLPDVLLTTAQRTTTLSHFGRVSNAHDKPQGRRIHRPLTQAPQAGERWLLDGRPRPFPKVCKVMGTCLTPTSYRARPDAEVHRVPGAAVDYSPHRGIRKLNTFLLFPHEIFVPHAQQTPQLKRGGKQPYRGPKQPTANIASSCSMAKRMRVRLDSP